MAHARLLRLVSRNLVQAVPTAIGVVLLNFFLLRLLPGDVADTIAMQAGSATAEQMAQLRERLGLNLSVVQQIVAYLTHLAHLDLGQSARYSAPVTVLIFERLPNTMLLVLTAMVFALLLGIVCGWVMSVFAGRWPDRLLSVLLLFAYAMPAFWLGLMAIVLFSVTLGWLPSNGNVTIGAPQTGWGAFVDRARYLVMPALTLSLFYTVIYARLTRTAMLQVQQQDFMRMAAAKGLHPLTLQIRHALRNALLPVTTMAGMHFGSLLGGAMVIETVFGWPGMGRLALDAVMGRDFPVILGILLLSSVLVIFANILVDTLQAWLDPRIAAR